MTDIKETIIKDFEEEFPHSEECLKTNKELGDKFNMQFGNKCMCRRRDNFKSFLLSSLNKVEEGAYQNGYETGRDEEIQLVEVVRKKTIEEIREWAKAMRKMYRGDGLQGSREGMYRLAMNDVEAHLDELSPNKE